MYIDFAYGTYGDPEGGAYACNEECMNQFCEKEEVGISSSEEIENTEVGEILNCSFCGRILQ